MVHCPSLSRGKSQLPEALAAVKLQLTDSAALVAVTVTAAPVVRLETEMVGVESLVRLSVLEEPLSDAAAKSGAEVFDI